MRLARFLASGGVGARRACEELIRAGRVTVNGERVESPARNVDPGRDDVRFDGRPVRPAPMHYLLLHKPPGVTCSACDAHAERLVTELLPSRLGRLFPVGRLDRDSEGALICTNDGALADRLMHPRYGIEKVYRVHVRGTLTPGVTRRFRQGIRDGGEFLRVRRAVLLNRNSLGGVLELVLTEGRKREIRRLCAGLGLRVVRLVRTAIGPVRLGGLPPGKWRHLRPQEIEQLLAAARVGAAPPDS